MKLSKLKNNPNNPRILKDDKFKKLVKSIKEFPKMMELRPMVIDKDNIVLGGNMRLKALKELGYKDIPNNWVKLADELTEAEKERFIIADNVGFGVWDWDELSENWDENNLIDWGLDIPDFEAEILEAKEDDYQEPETMQVDIIKGDLVEFVCNDGRVHRLLCGDSTCSDSVGKLMDGKKANMVLSDPPYGMSLETDYTGLNWGDRKGKKYDKVIGDNSDFKPELITTFFVNFGYCKEVFLWGADYFYKHIINFDNGHFIVWDKTLASNGDADSNSEFELCWTKQKHKRKVLHFNWFRYFGLSSQDTKKRLHPTQKPVQVNEYFIKNYSREKDLIIDLFLGSGSTMVAAHQLKRTCYGMELDEKYCQVIIDRMQKLDETLTVKINGKEYKKEAQNVPF